jgi:hypothetical protein
MTMSGAASSAAYSASRNGPPSSAYCSQQFSPSSITEITGGFAPVASRPMRRSRPMKSPTASSARQFWYTKPMRSDSS